MKSLLKKVNRSIDINQSYRKDIKLVSSCKNKNTPNVFKLLFNQTQKINLQNLKPKNKNSILKQKKTKHASLSLNKREIENYCKSTKFSTSKNIKLFKNQNKENIDFNKTQPLQKTFNVNELQWSDLKTPIQSNIVLKTYPYLLSKQEQIEIKNYNKIYFIPSQKSRRVKDNFGTNDQIVYRYEIIKNLGQGSFGTVLKCYDHKDKKYVAIKVIKNQKNQKMAAMIEQNILKMLNSIEDSQNNIVEMKQNFCFRGHQCIVFELLSINLFDLLKSNEFKGLDLSLIRRFTIQILNSLHFLKKNNVVHCDLKPENILLKNIHKSGIKLIDFGSACYINDRIFTYIQSRYYRAPEIILGYPYGFEIDMWSMACILSELYTGYPLFPGENEVEQISYFQRIIGNPDNEYLDKCIRSDIYFDETGNIKKEKKSQTLSQLLNCQDDQFIDFLERCFTWIPSKRMTPLQALSHPWIIDALPEDIRIQHQMFIQEEGCKRSKKVEYKIDNVQKQYNMQMKGILFNQTDKDNLKLILKSVKQSNSTKEKKSSTCKNSSKKQYFKSVKR